MHKTDKRLKILFLPAWWPSEVSPTNGIFVKEHACAVALYDEVVVVHSEGRSVGIIYQIFHRILADNIEDGIRVIRVRRFSSILSKILYPLYLLDIWCVVRGLIRTGWKPEVVHAHIFTKALVALCLKWLYGIPFVISEHWSRFPERRLTRGWVVVARFVIRRAYAILPVSEHLALAIQAYGISGNFVIVPNVVNTAVFFPVPVERVNQMNKMLFVGALVPTKGIQVLIQAVYCLQRIRHDFTVDLIGDGPGLVEYKKMVKEMGLEQVVTFRGVVPPQEVARFLKECDFLVQPSFGETFGVVCIEAMACGKPVVASDIPALRALVNKERGLLFSLGNVEQCQHVLAYMMDHLSEYSTKKIAQFAEDHFSYAVIGKMFNIIYRRAVMFS